MNTSDFKSFHYLENGDIIFSEMETKKSTKVLDSGSYVLSTVFEGNKAVPHIKLSTTEKAKVHSFPEKFKIDELFQSFFDPIVVENIKSLGFNHKVGILFHGRQGGGKTSIMRYYCEKLIKERQAIVFDLIPREPSNARTSWKFAQEIRTIQKNPIVFTIDECDDFMEYRESEGLLKTILDGNLSIDNSIVMAATNYLNRIPEAIKDRPSRFKYIICVEGIQDAGEVYTIIKNMIGNLVEERELHSFSQSLKGSTLDGIKQFCLDKIMDLETYKNNRSYIGFKSAN